MQADHNWQLRWIEMLEKIERVETPGELSQLLADLSAPTGPKVLAFANAHALNALTSSQVFFDALLAADLVLRDGLGMATLFKLMNMSPGLNLNGTDLIPQLIARFDGRAIAFYGTQEPWLARGAHAAGQLAPTSHFSAAGGFDESQAYVDLVRLHKPDLIVLGMGMPKQELVAAALRASIEHPCLIICGGAIIDFLGGRVPRAPHWMRKLGAEWLFRLLLEPQRLFQRYVIGNPVYLMRAHRLAARHKRPAVL